MSGKTRYFVSGALCSLAVLVSGAFSSGEILAQTEEAAVLEEIDIKGVIRREELQSTSATVLQNSDIVNRVYYQPLDMLKLSPGVYVGYYGESGVAPSFNIRGFSAGHGGADVTMYIDGIPIHDNGHATAYLDTGMIMPHELESLEIIKGPASVYYGQHSAGGSLAAQTIKGGNLTRLNVRYGSYNDIDVAGLIARESEKLAQVYAFEMWHTDGYRANSDWDKKNFSGRWTYRASDDLSIMLNLRAYESEWDSAGYISSARNDVRGWVDDGSGEGNGGERKRYDARLFVNYLLDNRSQLSYYLYGSTLDHVRYQINEQYPNERIGSSSGAKQANTHKSWGTGLTYSFNGDLGGRATTATLGLTYMFEKEDPNERYTLYWGTGRNTPALSSSSTYTLANPTVFGEITYQVLEQLNVRLGGRYDLLYGDFRNNMPGGGSSSSPRYRFFSPKVGVLFTPVDALSIYANFGRGFSTPGLSVNANTGFYADNRFELSTRDQYELGARMQITDWMNAELALFKIFTENDSTWDTETETNIPAGKTVRQGVEATVNIVPAENWRFTANFTYLDAKYKSFINGQRQRMDGYRMTGIPSTITNIELSYAPDYGFGGRVGLRYEAGNYFRSIPGTDYLGNPVATRPLVAKNQDKAFVDLQLSYRFNDNYRILLDVNNVLNKKYLNMSSWPSTPGGVYNFSPFNPLTAYLTLEMNWDK
ncbi:MAG: TonB-dependent receptor [Deltaproteobacteria bacterium]|nr:TonB-dependent receptor [Deltaproteobacteria bacterium]